MLKLTRYDNNPIVLPSYNNDWEQGGAFNGCVTKHGDEYIMVYRAMTQRKFHIKAQLEVSSIGIATSKDGYTFENHQLFITPEEDFEKFGCEDPRVTKIDDEYFIFYTALSDFPFSADNIKVALAVTKDFKTIERKELITPFNAKAMSLFPEKVDGRYVAILTANTDLPPSKIGLAYFDRKEEIWSENYWKSWYMDVDDHALPLLRSEHDQVEVGGPPVKTKDGWLLIYSYIRDYHSDHKIFGIEAVLLDHNNPSLVIGRTHDPLLIPEKEYELYGNIPNIAFPSGAYVKDDTLLVYYGAADTSTCVAECGLNELLSAIKPKKREIIKEEKDDDLFERFEENPILMPDPLHYWEAKGVYNPASIYDRGKMHILYRAHSANDTCTVGYAVSTDGLHIDERLPYPIYVPRESYEKKVHPGNSGCEDPRIVKIEEDDKFYMCYTAFNGTKPPAVAMSSISVDDFHNQQWNWSRPILISPPGVDDKDASMFPEKINGKYGFFHRIGGKIWVDLVDDLSFNGKYLDGEVVLEPDHNSWDNVRIGIAGPAIKTNKGWLMIYHGIDGSHGPQRIYKVGACMLDGNDPRKFVKKLDYPIFVPEKKWEKEGLVNEVVFPCGNTVVDGKLYIYYGGADSVTGVAWMDFNRLLDLF